MRIIKQDAMFELCSMPHNTIVANNDITTDIGAMADMTIFSNDARAFDVGAWLDNGAFSNGDEFWIDEVGIFLFGSLHFSKLFGKKVLFEFFKHLPSKIY